LFSTMVREALRKELMSTDPEITRPKVLHVLTSDISTRLVRGQLRYLRNKGYDVYLACSPGKELERFAKSEGIHAVPVDIQREISLFRDLTSLVRLYRVTRRIRPAICNYSTPKAGLIGSVAALLARVPFRVYTLRGLRWETASGLKRRILMLADAVASRSSHRIVCVSQNLRSAVIASRIARPQQTIVLADGSSNGVDHKRLAPTKERLARAKELRAQYGITSEAPVIGFVGRFTKDKGIEELYEAHTALKQEFPAIRMVLVGDFEDGNPISGRVKAAIKNDRSIVLPGFLADPSEWYHVFDVLAFPSHREGFPNVVLEAHAAAKPVVGARATGTSDAILDGVTGLLVPVNDSVSLSKALASLLHSPAAGVKMGAAAQHRVVEKFGSERIWEALAQEYRRGLRDRGMQSPEPAIHSQFDRVSTTDAGGPS
jgi:glycosyltransferase involved in cell wall biosynthesis